MGLSRVFFGQITPHIVDLRLPFCTWRLHIKCNKSTLNTLTSN